MASRITYVLWKFPVLSETFVVEELRALERHGLTPDIVALERPAGELANQRAEPLLARTTWLGAASFGVQLRRATRGVAGSPFGFVRCLVTALRTRSRWSLLDLWYGAQLASLVRSDGTEYLHAHFADHAGEVTWYAAQLTGVPYGVVAHGVDLYLGRFLCQKIRDAALPVTVCHYNVDQLVERCPDLERDRFLLKAAGIDPTPFLAADRSPHTRPPTVVAVGRLVEKKGFDVLIRAMSLLRDRGIDVECRIVGEGRCRSALEELVDDLGLDGVVHLEGQQAPEMVRSHLTGATLLAAPCTISPTGDRDSMPVVIKEAMAMELPVVASRDFGIPELVDDTCGILVPRDDPDALADAIGDVLAMSDEARSEMGRAGRSRVQTDFDEFELTRPLVDAIRRL